MRSLKQLFFSTIGCMFIFCNMFHLPLNETVMKEISFVNETYQSNSTIVYAAKYSPDKKLPLIIDSSKVDYMSYIPKMKSNRDIKSALDIKNPSISLAASSAILFNANTGEVLFYKSPVIAVFPSSTTKLLSSLVALDWCKKSDKITVGN